MENLQLDEFCGSTFWNSSLSWYTEEPDLTKCFERTVLVWIPSAFLLLFSVVDVYNIKHSKNRDIPWNWLNLLKLGATILLIVLAFSDLITNIKFATQQQQSLKGVELYTPFLKIATFTLSGTLVWYGRKYGIQSSGIQFIFWLLSVICGAAEFQTQIRDVSRNGEPEDYYEYVSCLINYPLVVLVFLLNCFSDQRPRISQYHKSTNDSPEENAGFLSYLLFAWFDRLMYKGFRRSLQQTDIWDLRHKDRAEQVVPKFERNWEKAVIKRDRKHAQNGDVSFKSSSNHVDFAKSQKKKPIRLLPIVIKTFGISFVFSALLKTVADILIFVNPQLLKLIMLYVTSGEPQWKGVLYATIMFVTASLQTVFNAHHFNKITIVGMHIRSSIISAIYSKSLRISNSARKQSTVGEIVNLMAVDAQKFLEMVNFINILWSAPMQIAIAVYFLWQELGPAVLAGFAVMILLIPLNSYIVNKNKTFQIKQMKDKDERVKLMNEVLSGIKVLKLYAWEQSFEERVQRIRKREVKTLRATAYLMAGTSLIWNCAPFLVCLVSFTTYVLLDEKNVLDANKAFVSLSLFNIVRAPLNMLPMVMTGVVQTYVSIKRLDNFLNAEELDPNNVEHDESETDPVVIEDGSFTWGDDIILKNINMRVSKGTLAAVVGSVGSGKSSLVSACLGEMDKLSGRVNTYGSIAFVPQQAWIQNATVRDNILLGKEFDHELYEKVLYACALKTDLEILPGGDQTEIGEKGINLSGGQRQRISLARAVYANSEVYLLDDPLSAVDSHVGKHIFENVIGPKGLLRHKTRILVTHGITFLPQTEQILVLTEGEISERGTYQELLHRKGAFAEFLLQHINEEVDDVEELDELVEQIAGTPIIEKLGPQIARKRSRVSESKSETGSVNGLMRQISTVSIKDSKHSSMTKLSSTKDLKAPPKRGKLIEAEKAETGNVKMDVYMHYLKSVGIHLILGTILFNASFQGFSIGSNVWLGKWSEDPSLVVNGTVNTGSRDMYLSVYGVLGLGQALSTMLANIVFAKGTTMAAVKLHNYVLYNVLRLPAAFFDVTPSGRILGRFSNDINGVDSRLPMNFNIMFTNSLRVIGTLVVITYTTPIFIFVVIPLMLLYMFIQRYYTATARQIKRIESVSKSPIYSHFGETISGAQVIRAYGKELSFIKESERKLDLNLTSFYASNITNRWLPIRLEMIANLIILFAALFAVLSKDMSPALVGLSITYSMQITQTLNFLVRMMSDVETNIVAVERIREYGEIAQEAPWEIPSKRPPAEWPPKGTVSFKNYSVRYRPGLDLVLKNLNFDVNGGEKIGIVGRTGAGKSSLTLSLFRIIEAAEGHIEIDGINIANMGLHNLRSRLTIIPQDPVLFSGSLRMNLDPFETHSDDELWNALQHAHLKDYVKGLPLGLQHQVTEGGENLSVGQRQLICLARALLRKTKILVLDEATAAIDLETDDLIQKTIRTEFKDCTVITIAHRINTIMDSDRVIVLDKGTIAEFDTPNNLLNNSDSIFYGMCKDAGLA